MIELQKQLEEHYKKNKEVYAKEEYLKGEIKKLQKKIDKERKQYEFVSNCLYTFAALWIIYVIFFLM